MLRDDPFVTDEYYHLYNRGIDKRVIFKTKFDYERFMMLLVVANSEESIRLDNLINHEHRKYEEIIELEKEKPIVSIGAWCILSNHFHILVRQDVDGGITKFMKKLGTAYSMYFNIKYQRQGALFGGPFKSKLIGANDRYMRHMFGYIHLNPLDIKFPEWKKNLDTLTNEKKTMKSFLESYQYSSYPDYIAEDRSEKSILNREAFPDYFGQKSSMDDFIEDYLENEHSTAPNSL
ncbi:MAG: transposase [Candidatus Pacebacteria bacterium]|nr:transposase [Candidatus Paceibacterota bacterium]MDD5357162.1 transposase [Candidatus Paceibacterota bacterium]